MINYPISAPHASCPRQRCTHAKLCERREMRVFSTRVTLALTLIIKNHYPNPNSNSNPNSRGQRGRNECVRGVIKGKVSLSAHVLPTHRELTRTPRFLLHTQSVYHSLVQTDHQHSLTTCLLNKKCRDTKFDRCQIYTQQSIKILPRTTLPASQHQPEQQFTHSEFVSVLN